MTCNVIATGSTGNAVVLNDELLIDCGVPFRALEPFYKKLKLVLPTHIHGDHFNPGTIKALHFRRPALRFACPLWLYEVVVRLGVDRRVIDVCDHRFSAWYQYGESFAVSNVSVPHDVPNCAWRVQAGGELAFYATDCGSLDGIEAKNYDLYLVEANHTRAELAARLAAKEAVGEYAYERRAAEVHLSQEQALDWLAENLGSRSRYLLIHQHKEREARA